MRPLIFCLLSLPAILCAQDDVFRFQHTIPSAAFGTDRTITVYLPPAYHRRPETKYTITYVLDGQYAPVIEMTEKIIAYNVNAGKITPTIVVGVHSENRGAEFSLPRPDDEYQEGRAPALQAHLRNEVFPLIDSLYPEHEPYRSVVGHSSGGAFVLLTLLSEQHDLFDGYLAIGPALRPDQQTILEDAEKYLASGATLPRLLHCSAGTVGEREELFGGAIDRLAALLDRHPGHGIRFTQDRFAGLDHWSVVAPAVLAGQIAQTRALRADVKTMTEMARRPSPTLGNQLDEFYQQARATFGYAEVPPAGYLDGAAEELKRLGLPRQAVALYDWSIGQYPEEFRLEKYRAVLLAELGDSPGAKTGLERSITLLNGRKDTLRKEEYDAHLEDIQERLAALNRQ